jgi:hypothetical protein
MEAKGIAVWQLGIGDGARGGSRPAVAGYRERTGRRTETESPQARSATRWSGGDPPEADNTGLSPLSIISQAGILGARVRKGACLPREICRASIRTERTVRGDYRVAEVSRGHSSPPQADEGPNGPQPNGLGKWLWLSKSVFLPVLCSRC